LPPNPIGFENGFDLLTITDNCNRSPYDLRINHGVRRGFI